MTAVFTDLDKLFSDTARQRLLDLRHDLLWRVSRDDCEVALHAAFAEFSKLNFPARSF